jgi:ATP-binding cassette subfamily B protein
VSFSYQAAAEVVLALVGPSGAGKTTIAALAARLYDANTGTGRIGGHDVRDVTIASLHDVVGVVTQDAHLFHDTIRANLPTLRQVDRPGEIPDRQVTARPRP